MYNFSAGRARLIPAGGGTPLELGVVQNATLELKVDLKELRGAYRYPITVADGKGTASGKVAFAQLWPATLGAITGGTVGVGAPIAVIGEKHTIPATGGATTTLVQASTLVIGTEIVTVIDATGSPVYYARALAGSEVSSSTAGQANGKYSISATGVLTFPTTDAGLRISVDYLYQPTVGVNNSSIALSQVGMNQALTFQLMLIGTGAKNIYTNAPEQFLVVLNSCLAPSLKMDFKLDDFTMLDLDFMAFIDANGSLGNLYLINPS